MAEGRVDAEQVFDDFEERFGAKYPKAVACLSKDRDALLAFYDFPAEHWIRIRTNNPLERIIREIRRRTRVVGTFPDGNSALMLCAARLRHIAGTKWGNAEISEHGFVQRDG